MQLTADNRNEWVSWKARQWATHEILGKFTRAQRRYLASILMESHLGISKGRPDTYHLYGVDALGRPVIERRNPMGIQHFVLTKADADPSDRIVHPIKRLETLS